MIAINFRSGIGYGRSFREAENTGMRGASEYQDVLAGAKYLQTRPEVDPDYPEFDDARTRISKIKRSN